VTSLEESMAERTALIVGASRGLGLGLVKELVARGWDVIATLRSPATASGLADFAKAHDGKVRIETLDVEKGDQIDALAKRLSGVTLDLLFVNAGIALRDVSPATATREEVARIFVTNAVAPIHVAEAFRDQMREGSGVIAVMSSGLGSVANNFRGGADLYSASKAALNKLTRGFAASLGGGGKLTVLAISPGWVRTDMGGPSAMLSIEDSCRGVVDVIEAKAGTGDHGFYSHEGATVAW
jgi:NAD(P)-dependent dehydrogenase (short-subunit alcohol dehydrogenase family)